MYVFKWNPTSGEMGNVLLLPNIWIVNMYRLLAASHESKGLQGGWWVPENVSQEVGDVRDEPNPLRRWGQCMKIVELDLSLGKSKTDF